MKRQLEVRQKDFRDCGVCCLLSVIKNYNGFVSLEKLRLDTYTNNEGTSFYHLLSAARKYGFDGTGVVVDTDKLLHGEVFLPAIAHLVLENGMFHFVVIYKVSNKYIYIMDPAEGFKKMALKDFEKVWSKRLLVLYPQQKIIKQEKDKNMLSHLLDILKIEKTLVIKLLLCSIAFTILSIIISFYLKIAIDDISLYQNSNSFKIIFLIFIILTIIKIVLKYIKDYLENYLNKNIDIRIIMPFINHIFLLPLNIVKSRSTGEITSRINDLNHIKNLFSKIFVTICLDLLLASLSLFVLFSINRSLTFLLLLILGAYIILGLLFNKPIYKKIRKNIDLETEFSSNLVESIEGILSIKNINQTNYILEKIEHFYTKYLKDSFFFNKFVDIYELLKEFISEIGLFLVTSYGIYLILNNKLDILSLITFNTLLVYLFDPIKNIVDLLPNINHLKATLEKVSDFYNHDQEKLVYKKESFSNGDIKILNLTYSYNDYDQVIDKFGLEVKMGSKIFLKGSSGSGKSTLCKLIYRLFEYTKGTIMINGININDYNLNTIRENISYLAQKENLFTDTIKNNILFGRKISLENLNKIIDICEIDKILENKPLRLETLLIDGGFNLSGGEKQRIALARTLVKNANIIILDEALSEVEEEMEVRIINNILKEYEDKTIIYVSHRDNSKLFNQTISMKEIVC